jgi:hypothetical protein
VREAPRLQLQAQAFALADGSFDYNLLAGALLAEAGHAAETRLAEIESRNRTPSTRHMGCSVVIGTLALSTRGLFWKLRSTNILQLCHARSVNIGALK